jgi:hypothetical protein
LVLAALLAVPIPASAIVLSGPNVSVAYSVDATALKAAISGTALTFALYADSTCATSVYTTMINIENVDLIEALKRFNPKGATKPPKTAVIHATLIGVPPGSSGYLKVTGTGITAVGGACQAQAGAAGSSPVIASALLSQAAGGSVTSFGGNGTTSAAIDTTTFPCAFIVPPGNLCVTFTGSYPTGVAAGNLVVLSSGELGGFATTNNSVIAASDTSITVSVAVWESDTLTSLTNDMKVAVLFAP